MAKKIQQFIYNNINTVPTSNILSDYNKIVQIGIQANPGTKFKLNRGESLQIGNSGIFELILNDSYIIDLQFTDIVYDDIEKTTYNIIVDILYEEERDA